MESVVSMMIFDLDFYRGKKVFITGHTGFKGSWLCQMLLLSGAEITGYALPAEDNSLFQQLKLAQHLCSLAGDVRDETHLLQAVRQAQPEIIIHLAAQPLVRQSYQTPVATYATNVMGTVHILEAIRQSDTAIAFLNVTTDKVYYNQEWLWGYRENETLCGRDPYANSKSCSELVTYSYQQSFFQGDNYPAISTARSGNVIGGGDNAKDRIIPDCLRATQNGQIIKVRHPLSVRPYQHVLDCLYGYLLLIQKQTEDKTLSSSYNFGPDENDCLTTGELVQTFCDIWGDNQRWQAENDALNYHEDHYLRLDNSKAKRLLHWQPCWSAQQAVEKTIQWVKALQAGQNCRDIMQQQIEQYRIDGQAKMSKQKGKSS